MVRAAPAALAASGAPQAGSQRRRCRYTAPSFMANIHSQKKRILRSERERLENKRYTSTIKTYFRRLSAAVAGGDDAAADAEHRKLDLDDRPGRQDRRAAPQHRCAQEVPRRARSRRASES